MPRPVITSTMSKLLSQGVARRQLKSMVVGIRFVKSAPWPAQIARLAEGRQKGTKSRSPCLPGNECDVSGLRRPRRLSAELVRTDVLLDDPVFFGPFVPFFDPRMGRLSTPMETHLRLMYFEFRYRLGYESLCREVSDSITR
jgi:hypothetical protein